MKSLPAALALLLAAAVVAPLPGFAQAPPAGEALPPPSPVTSEPLAGHWLLVEFAGAPVTAPPELRLNIDPDGAVGGHDGCNAIANGHVAREGTEVAFAALVSTMMACLNTTPVADAFGNTLSLTRAAAIEDGLLVLKNADGAVLGRLKRDAAVPR